MDIMIFGGTGFIGNALAERLCNEGHQVDVLSRKARVSHAGGPNYLVGDLIAGAYPSLSVYDVIINCAGEINNQELMRSLHVDALSNVLESLPSHCKTRWIEMSSVGVYGPIHGGVVRESNEFNPVGMYEETKAEAEIMVREVCKVKGIDYTIIRPSNVFGEGMPNRSLAQLLTMVKKGLFFYIGNPDSYVMNYVHVQDVVEITIKSIEQPQARNQDFIISDSISQREFVKVIKEELGGKRIVQVPKMLVKLLSRCGNLIPHFPLTGSRVSALTLKSFYSVEKAEKLLGYTPSVGIEAGLRNYCRHLKSSM
ncbi:NAD-dependent epimerase/dehydratase family protein [Halopseudomonas laoshanensis]|uniref:NAD-dependent epimerase/dehydratase family protein n=1 Tax=Halopseudomonas laoshanensis TaxID=2268758 RepID=UPI003736491A